MLVGTVPAGTLAVSAAPPATAPIRPEELRAEIAVLASDRFEGRAPGSTGETLTIDYLRDRWRAVGLQPAGEGGDDRWLQPVPLIERRPFAQSVQARADGRIIKLPEDGLLLLGREATGMVDAPLTYIGYGLDRANRVRADVRGRIAVVLGEDPPWRAADRRTRERLLVEAGAVGVLTVAAPAEDWDDLRTRFAAGATRLVEDDNGAGLAGYVRSDAWRALAGAGGLGLAKARRLARSDRFAGRALPVTMHIATSNRVRRFDSHNVIGRIPGRRPGSGAVLLLAHWDHLGLCGAPDAVDRICNGAVDNASGVAVLTLVADRLAKAPPLDRDVYVLATTAEERGLLGATYFAAHPPLPLDQIAIAINIDTIAIRPPGAPVAIIGRGSHGFDADIDAVSRSMGRDVDADQEANTLIRRQDGWALAQKGVPTVMVGGAFSDIPALDRFFEGRYHGVEDAADAQLELGGAAEDADLHVALARHFADITAYPGPAPAH